MNTLEPELESLIPQCYRLALAVVNNRQLAIELTSKVLQITNHALQTQSLMGPLNFFLLRVLYREIFYTSLTLKKTNLSYIPYQLKRLVPRYSLKTRFIKWCIEQENFSPSELQPIVGMNLEAIQKRLQKTESLTFTQYQDTVPYQKILEQIQYHRRKHSPVFLQIFSLKFFILITCGIILLAIPTFLWFKNQQTQEALIQNRYEPGIYSNEGKVFLKVFIEKDQLCTLKSLLNPHNHLYKSLKGKADLFVYELTNTTASANIYELFNFKLDESYYFAIPGRSRLSQRNSKGNLLEFIKTISNHYHIPVELHTNDIKQICEWEITGSFPSDVTKIETNLPNLSIQLLDRQVARVQTY